MKENGKEEGQEDAEPSTAVVVQGRFDEKGRLLSCSRIWRVNFSRKTLYTSSPWGKGEVSPETVLREVLENL